MLKLLGGVAFGVSLLAQLQASAPTTSTANSPVPAASDPSDTSVEDLKNWKHPPPVKPLGRTVIPSSQPGAVRLGLIPEAGCLPGFTRFEGICILSPTLLPNLATVAFPMLKPGMIGTKSVTHASVVVEGALINASKTGGDCWDFGCNQPTDGKSAKNATLAIAGALKLAGNPWVAATAALMPVISKGFSPPDPYGYATIYYAGNSASEAHKLPKNQDSRTPSWNVAFHHVPIANGTYLRVEMWDADMVNDDSIGTVMINADELAEALKAGKTRRVRVNEESYEQALFVNISVLAED